MSRRDDQNDEALKRLDKGLDAFEASRARSSSSDLSGQAGAFRFLGEVIGGVLGGLGLGWLFDHFAHTLPWGTVGGTLIGLVISVILVIRGASQAADNASKRAGPLPSVPDDDDDED
jgi:ATP synthase protein I